MGDLNAQPHTEEMKSLYGFYKDAFADQNDAYMTPSGNPNRRIDYIFTSKKIETAHAEVIDTIASDHLPIIIELTLDPSIFKKEKHKKSLESNLVLFRMPSIAIATLVEHATTVTHWISFKKQHKPLMKKMLILPCKQEI